MTDDEDFEKVTNTDIPGLNETMSSLIGIAAKVHRQNSYAKTNLMMSVAEVQARIIVAMTGGDRARMEGLKNSILEAISDMCEELYTEATKSLDATSTIEKLEALRKYNEIQGK